MSIREVDLDRIVKEIWAAVLGLSLQQAATDRAHPPGESIVTGAVQITGAWNGVVTIECSRALARLAAAAMFGAAADELSDDDVRDSVGELANMTGGNVKSLIGEGCQLSLPTVTEGRDYHVTIPGSRPVDCRRFDSDGELLVVTTLERLNG